METKAPVPEIVDEVKAAGGHTYRLCYQCGKCDAVCPWNRVRSFSMRKTIREASLGIPEIESDDLWRCTTCGTCPQKCPRGVDQIKLGVSLRRVATNYDVLGASAGAIRSARGNLATRGNPFGEERAARTGSAEGLAVKPFAEGMEMLFFGCCYLSYDARLKKVARAAVEILNRAGVDFGVLGSAESCCGESIRKTGAEKVFRDLARENIKAFIDRGVKKIVVASPHCYEAFRKDYAEFMVNFEVLHISQLLLPLLREGRLKVTGEYRKKVTYHDPCYLGRHNGIYDEPREVLRHIPGLDLVEMRDTRQNSLCCGGGGGGVWMETPKKERFSNLRVKQAVDAGAAVLATACPYCITMFEESRLGLEAEGSLEVRDITEIVRDVTH
ncbi:MAG: (Fe-S)-binding protein [Planctomycetes bacterium]|nr:(Fe-S)-binding protein [Planctomycetota bacterium]